MVVSLVFILILSLLPLAGMSSAQGEGTTVATGLNGPMGVLVAPDGSVWVIDSGTGGETEVPGVNPQTGEVITATLGDTAQVVQITPDGQQTVVANLPSILQGMEATGGARLALLDDTLYATTGFWIEDAGPDAAPNMAIVARIDGDQVTEVANLWNLERDQNPGGFIQEAHPYGLAAGPDGNLWVTEAGANDLLRINPATGEVEVVTVFDGVPSPLPNEARDGAMESDPVPTGIVFGQDGNAYVSFLPGFPFLPGSAKVVRVTPDGEVSDYATGLTMLTDLRAGPDGNMYAVQIGQFTEQGPVPNSGAIIRIQEGDASEVVLSNLSFPTSIDFNADGDAYVTINGVGAPGSGEVVMYSGLTSQEGTPLTAAAEPAAPAEEEAPAAGPPAQADGQEYVVQADDWLSRIAERFYGDVLSYTIIVEATNARAAEDSSFAVINNPDVIEIGQKLWIPNVPASETMAEPATADTTEAVTGTAITTDTTEVVTGTATTTDTTEAVTGTVDASLPASYALPGEAVFPEGVAFNPASNKFYVGSTTDGTLYEGDLASSEATVFSEGGADGRTTAIGMKVDSNGNLWVAGGGTGQMFVYNTADGSLVASYTTPEVEQTFINDVTFTPDGSAYFTDSLRPILFRISGAEGGEAEAWLDFTGTALEYVEGFNLNGIAATPDGRYLLTVQTVNGNLYRIDTTSQEIIQVDVGEADLTAGDGILLIGDTLYVSRNSIGEIVPVTMSEDYSTGTAGEAITDPSLIFPTTLAQADGSLLVVNSQFNNREGTPQLPFTVSRIPLPN
jgi:sugar lactone lactonase YvrE